MTHSAQFKLLGEINGVKWYWADPSLFDKPGVYYFDGKDTVQVMSPRKYVKQEDKCPNLSMKGGCPLHNLQCGYPDCNL